MRGSLTEHAYSSFGCRTKKEHVFFLLLSLVFKSVFESCGFVGFDHVFPIFFFCCLGSLSFWFFCCFQCVFSDRLLRTESDSTLLKRFCRPSEDGGHGLMWSKVLRTPLGQWLPISSTWIYWYLGLLQLLHLLSTSNRSSDREGHELDRLQRKKKGVSLTCIKQPMSLQRVCLHLTWRRTTLVTWQQFWSCKKLAWPFWQSIFLVLAGSWTASVATTSQKENLAKRVSRRSGCAPSLSRKPMPFLSSFLCVRPLQYFKNGAKNAPGRPALLFEFGTFCGGGQAKIMPHIFSAGIVLTALPEYVRLHNPPGACKFPSKWCIYAFSACS